MVELPQTKSTAKSVVFMSMHRAGSSIVNRLLRRMLAQVGMVPVDFARTAFAMGVDEARYCTERSHLLSTPGYYFGAFRGPYVQYFGDLSASRLVVQVRDPRDCIISLYFSVRYSHGLPGGDGEARATFQNLRNDVAAIDIDTFALTQVEAYAHRLQVISKVLETYPEALLLKYEDMILHFSAWFQKLREFLDVPVSQGDFDRYRTAVLPCEEDVTKHRRQMLPGDFRRKLKIETQEAVTRALRGALEQFGYLDSLPARVRIGE